MCSEIKLKSEYKICQYASDFSHPEKEKEVITGNLTYMIVLKHLPTKFISWPIKGNNFLWKSEILRLLVKIVSLHTSFILSFEMSFYSFNSYFVDWI